MDWLREYPKDGKQVRVETFHERTGEQPYQWVSLGYRFFAEAVDQQSCREILAWETDGGAIK